MKKVLAVLAVGLASIGTASAAVDATLLTSASTEITADIASLLAWAFPLVVAALVATKVLGLTKRFGSKV